MQKLTRCTCPNAARQGYTFIINVPPLLSMMIGMFKRVIGYNEKEGECCFLKTSGYVCCSLCNMDNSGRSGFGQGFDFGLGRFQIWTI